MEGPQPGESPDNEYMAMDSDPWEDQDDTYENGDTLDIGIRQREVVPVPGGATQLTNRASRQTNDTPNRPQINSLPLPSRYMTLRWPPPNGNIASAKTEQLAFLQRTMVGLVLLCLLLLVVVLGLSFACDILARLHKWSLEKQLEGIGLGCGPRYYISNAENQTSDSELHVLNCEMLKKFMSQESFVLHLQNGSCNNSWKCEC
ncbi:uncharacterized protein LOC114141562 [Xiphophorus couchianus]|uniref:uncharacterized protein LOC114141562 n=1 Tax=Xiphophorus couchianus TaxID=32473 RepID=UPI0010166EF4|nr:uncharacterized protein LOC114141562 [Xiphophorus couchianus]